LKAINRQSLFTNQIAEGKLLRVPIAHGEGCYFADEATVKRLQTGNQILFQYVNSSGVVVPSANPNGSVLNIAGICNERGNVAGMMPHPERACEPLLGSEDGRLVFESLIHGLKTRKKAA
jgi:phosphoribosylformylglycinamidine synthase